MLGFRTRTSLSLLYLRSHESERNKDGNLLRIRSLSPWLLFFKDGRRFLLFFPPRFKQGLFVCIPLLVFVVYGEWQEKEEGGDLLNVSLNLQLFFFFSNPITFFSETGEVILLVRRSYFFSCSRGMFDELKFASPTPLLSRLSFSYPAKDC